MTSDETLIDEIAQLRAEVGSLAALLAQVITMLEIRTNPGVLPAGRPAVFLTRNGSTIEARHVVVHHQRVMDAAEAMAAVRDRGYAYVLSGQAGAVLDAFGVAND